MEKTNWIILLAIFLVFWKLFIPGPKVAGDFQIIQPEILKMGFNIPQAWTSRWAEGMGEYSVGTLWSWPLDFLYGLGSFVGADFWILERLLGLFPAIFLSFWSMGRLLKYLGISGWGKLIGSIFYLLNSYFLLLLDGGQLNLALAYSILPFIFVLFKKLIEKNDLRNQINFGLGTILISVLDIRIILILLILVISDFLFSLFFHFMKNGLKLSEISALFLRFFLVGLITSLMLILIHAYWIMPSFLSQSPTLPPTYNRPSQLSELSFNNIGHTMNLLQSHWYKNIFGRVAELEVEFVLIPVLIFLAPVLRRGDKRIGFWLLISLIGIFLSKGINPPFGQINLWLFNYIPGFSLFRDPTKFFFLICLGYSICLSITVSELINISQRIGLQKKWTIFLPIIILMYIFWLIRPVYLGQMTGILGDQPYQREYNQLTNFLKSDRAVSRILWIPTKPPLSFSSPTHPSVEASRLSQKRSFSTGIVGTYETLNFLREASFSAELADVAGIGYIVYPFLNLKKEDTHPDNIRYYYTFNQQLSDLPWLSKVTKVAIPTYQVRKHQDEIFSVPDIWWVVGSDDLYEMVGEGKLNLNKNGFIFADEYAGLGERIDELPEAKIMLNKKELTDLAGSFIKSNDLVSPAAKLGFDPDFKSGWWKREAIDLIRWRSFLKEKYGIDNQDFDLGMGWAIGEGSVKLELQSKKIKKDQILLARVLESTRSGNLIFSQDNLAIGQINTKKEGNNVKWFEVGILKSSNPIYIEGEGDINVVNTLAILDKNLWENFKLKAERLKKGGRIQELSQTKSEEPVRISFKKLSPTAYQITVANLTHPSLLILSQTYNGLWKLGSQYSFPVYSLLNGFRVEKNGEYQIDFEPQEHVKRGFVISILTFLSLLFLLL